MKWVVFNGSPRREESNTQILFDQFLAGFRSGGNHDIKIVYLADNSKIDDQVKMFADADTVLIGFPLYADAMPALVKSFIEKLIPIRGRPGNPAIGFIVQSGFPEAIHSRYLEKYLQRLAWRLNCFYLGTIIKGGVEGIRSKPAWMTRKLFTSFFSLGKHLARHGEFDKKIIDRLAKPERFPVITRLIFRLMAKTGIFNLYWNKQLKKNGAFENLFHRPYETP